MLNFMIWFFVHSPDKLEILEVSKLCRQELHHAMQRNCSWWKTEKGLLWQKKQGEVYNSVSNQENVKWVRIKQLPKTPVLFYHCSWRAILKINNFNQYQDMFYKGSFSTSKLVIIVLFEMIKLFLKLL